jgi:hypothetical protein
MSIDLEFAEICDWLTKRGLQASTRRGQSLIIYRKEKKYPLEVRNGKLTRKEKK